MSRKSSTEQQAIEQIDAAQPVEQQALDSKISQAEQAKPEQAFPKIQSGDAGELQAQVAGRQYDDALEADKKIDQSKDVGVTAKSTDIQNFEKSKLMTNQEVNVYLESNLPAEHVNGDLIREIRYEDRFRQTPDGAALGECKTDDQGHSEIELYRQSPEGSYSREDMEHTLTHEVGHNVYWNLPAEARSDWDNLSSTSQADNYVSEYARTNTREDFAESYSHYVRDPVVLRDASMPKYNFLRDKVFSGRQYG